MKKCIRKPSKAILEEAILRVHGDGDFAEVIASILRSIARVDQEMKSLKQKCEKIKAISKQL
jgi:hypothetical protein